MLNGTYRRVSLFSMDLLKVFLSCDIETAKVLNLISILMDSRLFFEFIHEMYDEKLRIGETEITERDLNVFFANKAMQSEVVAGWTDTAVKKLKQCFCRMMYEAGLLESSAKPRIMRRIHDDAKLLGRPENFDIHIREVYVNAGAGFVVALTGAIMTMPGLPKVPAANGIDVEDGKITGLF